MRDSPQGQDPARRSGHGSRSSEGRIVCLSNVFDDQYLGKRGEAVAPCLSTVKRRDLFRCLNLATGWPIVVLSAPPRALDGKGRWLPAVESRFDTYPQFFCANWDLPKLRIILSWWFYALHVLRRTRTGDVVLIDNYELIYVIAAWITCLWRKVDFILDYEDGKHVIDRSIWRAMSGLAEVLGRPLLKAAFVAHPNLAARLRPTIPRLLVPGFTSKAPPDRLPADRPIRFLYSGSLDLPRGIDLLLAALPMLPPEGWSLEICGTGPLSSVVSEFVRQTPWQGKVTFHRLLSDAAFKELAANCDVGLNCQKLSDPISAVTFPSKIFTYLSAGLLTISSRASRVDEIVGSACLYYDADTPEQVAEKMRHVIGDYDSLRSRLNLQPVIGQYSIESTASRVQSMFLEAQLL